MIELPFDNASKLTSPMASSSTGTLTSIRPHAHPFDSYDLDIETSRLIAQLTLDDIAEISGTRKGKARADVPLSDEEIAFQIQGEFWESALRTIGDRRMAESISNAIEADDAYLNATSIVEQAAQDDRQGALALSSGRELPQPSHVQRLLEDANLSVLLEQ